MPPPILVTYEIIGPADAPETGVTSSFELLGYNTSSNTSPEIPTVQVLREAFPYLGKFHFRAKIPLPSSSPSQHAWLDLADDDAPLPVWVERNARQCVEIRALPLLLPKAPGEDEEEEGGELDFSGPDLDQDIVEASTYGEEGVGWEEGDGYEARARPRQTEQRGRHSSFLSSSSHLSSSWSRQLKDVGESVLTSDVARDLTKTGLKVGKQVGKHVNKLWRLVGEGLAAGGGGGGGGAEGGDGEYPSSPQGPSAGAVRYLRKWEEALVTPPDAELLSTLGTALFPPGEGGREGGQGGRINWRRAGCEGEEPMRDLRGTGSMCVKCLIYVARTYPRKIQQILGRQEDEEEEGREGGHGYPLMGVANSLTLMLADIFKLRDGRYVHVQNVFWPLFEGGGFGTMEEVFSAALGYLDHRWVETEAGIEGFPRLVQQVRRGLEGVLGQAPVSLPHFQAMAEEAGLYME